LLVALLLRPRAGNAGNLLVANFLRPSADGVGDRLVANFLGVVANRVRLFVGRRAGNLTANRVGNLAVLHFALVAGAADFLIDGLLDPDAAAAGRRRALHFDDVAATGVIQAAASAGVIFPVTRIALALIHHGARNRFRNILPFAALHRNDLLLGDRLADRVAIVSVARLVARTALRVADVLVVRLEARLADGEAAILVARLKHELRVAVGDLFANVIVDRLAARVALLFPNRLVDRLVRRAGRSRAHRITARLWRRAAGLCRTHVAARRT